MNDLRDQRRRAYLDRVFNLMLGSRGDDIMAKALIVTELWDAQPGVRHVYSQKWRALLERDVSAVRAAALADTSEAADLRHCMPFAGILSNKERADLRASVQPGS